MAVVVDRTTRFTCEHCPRFPEDGRRHEIVEGDHQVSQHGHSVTRETMKTAHGAFEFDLREVW